ncbi:MAG: hypothetical protein R3F30_08365 [Planctomycetota bacterium]
MKFLALALVAAPLAAQSSTLRIVPPEAATSGNSQMYYVSVYDAGRMQQVVAGSAFCKTTALIQEVDLRADGVNALPIRSFSNLKFYAGYAATTPTTMSSTFASNRGAVTKPSTPPTRCRSRSPTAGRSTSRSSSARRWSSWPSRATCCSSGRCPARPSPSRSTSTTAT